MAADGYGEAESLFLDVSALVPEADLGLPSAFRSAGAGAGYDCYGLASASTRAGAPPRRAAAMNRRPASVRNAQCNNVPFYMENVCMTAQGICGCRTPRLVQGSPQNRYHRLSAPKMSEGC